MDDDKFRFLESLVRNPEETGTVEYKSALCFDPKSDFGVKVVKHILAHANGGGGYVVIGCAEDAHGKLRHDPDLNEQIAKSYETTRLCQSVDSYLAGGQRIELLVHKISYEGKVYPIVSVQGFKGSPLFCGKDFLGKDGKLILKEGAVYIRDHAAKTVTLGGPQQWDNLLKVALEQKQSETLDRMRALLEGLGLELPTGSSQRNSMPADLEQWLTQERNQMNLDKKSHKLEGVGFLEVVHYPMPRSKTWTQAELLNAAAMSRCRNTGWPVGLVLTVPEHSPKPLSDGIRASIYSNMFGGSFDYWSLERHGAFYFVRAFEEDLKARSPHKVMYFNTRIWRLAEIFLHCVNLAKKLELEPTTEMVFEIGHYNLRGRILTSSDPARDLDLIRANATADQVVWRKRITFALVESNWRRLVQEVLGEVFVLFDFWTPSEGVWKGVIDEFSNSRV